MPGKQVELRCQVVEDPRPIEKISHCQQEEEDGSDRPHQSFTVDESQGDRNQQQGCDAEIKRGLGRIVAVPGIGTLESTPEVGQNQFDQMDGVERSDE